MHDDSIVSFDLRPLAVDVPPEYVLGHPIHVAITVTLGRGDFDRLEIPHVPWFDVFSSPGLGVTLVDSANGAVAVDVAPRSYNPEWIATFTLRSDEPHRMLVDLSATLPTHLAAGRYLLTLRYPLPLGVATSPAVPVVFREPTERERERLTQLTPFVRAAGSWGAWTTTAIARSGLRTDVPIEPDDPLRLNLLLRRWRLGREHARALGDALDRLVGVYAPEREMLRAERVAALGDEATAAALARQVRSAHPELAWWADALLSGDVWSWTGLRVR